MSFLIIALKDLKVIFRDRTALIFTFAFPLLFVLLFGSMFGGRGSGDGKRGTIKILVENQDKGLHGAAVMESMQLLGLGVDKETAGADDLIKRVRNGEHAVGVVIPPDFSKTVDTFVQQSAGGTGNPSPASLMVYVDPAQSDVAGIAKGAISGATQRVTGLLYAHYFGQPADQGAARAPVTLTITEAPNPESTAEKTNRTPGDLIIPGFMVYFVFFLANGVAAALINERQEGTLRRMLSAPITRGQILFGKMLARGILGAIQVLMLFEIGRVWLHLSSIGSPFGVALIAFSTIFTATGLGLIIATFGRTQEQIQGMTTLLLFLMGGLSGTMFPRFLLPESIQKIGFLTPHAWALNAYQDVMLRGRPLTETLGNIAVVLVFGLVFYGIAFLRFRYE